MKKFLEPVFKRKKPRPDALYWEYFNRINVVAGKIKKLGHDEYRVLDVGGSRRDNLFRKFGIKNVTVANVHEDSDVTASCHRLSFKDGSFECVACIDTLEHIPQEIRDAAVRELMRVASKAVFIVAPVNSEENDRAERIVLRHLPSSFLKEHQRYGLVDFDKIKCGIGRLKKERVIERVVEEGLDDLMYWVAMMLGDKVEVSELYQELYFLENKFHPRRKAISVYLK